jgi:hypothetical protein
MLQNDSVKLQINYIGKDKLNKNIQGVSAKTFEPNNSVIFQRIFVKFKMHIF